MGEAWSEPGTSVVLASRVSEYWTAVAVEPELLVRTAVYDRVSPRLAVVGLTARVAVRLLAGASRVSSASTPSRPRRGRAAHRRERRGRERRFCCRFSQKRKENMVSARERREGKGPGTV